MSFIWPWVLLSLLALPLCLFVYVRLQRRRGRDAASLGTLGAVREGATKRLGTRKHIPPALILLGVALLALASARPQLTVPLPRMEGTVVLTFDVSASMAADDARADEDGGRQGGREGTARTATQQCRNRSGRLRRGRAGGAAALRRHAGYGRHHRPAGAPERHIPGQRDSDRTTSCLLRNRSQRRPRDETGPPERWRD